MKEADGKIVKIHKSIAGMMTQAQKIIKPSPTLPPILQSNTHLQVLLPQNKNNNHLKLLLQQSSNRYSKISRAYVKSQKKYDTHQQTQFSHFISRKSTGSKSPMFFNRHSGSFEKSTILNKYQHDIMENNVPKLTRRSNRQIYQKKMINLLPEIPSERRRIGGKVYVRTDPLPTQRYHATISTPENIHYKRPQSPQFKQSKTIQHSSNFKQSKNIQNQLNFIVTNNNNKPGPRSKRQKLKNIISKIKINSGDNPQPDLLKQNNEEQTYEPWKSNDEDDDYLFS